MADVVSLPGVSRHDLVDDAPVNDVLASAMELPLSGVVVVGRNLNGDIEVLSTQADADMAIGLLMRGVKLGGVAGLGEQPDRRARSQSALYPARG
jgi:hypothetical protein